MIVCQGISKSFPAKDGKNDCWILKNVDITIEAGEFVCLLGPSGCGKTTLLNIIAGFVFPTHGQVLFNETLVTAPGPDRGVVFQDPTLFPWLTAAQNIAFGLINIGVDKTQRDARVADCLRLVGMEDKARSYPHELSGGMRQRIALARVLALEPQALLMDEPFSALDAISRERLQDELLDIWALRRIPVVFVTHNADEAVYLADRIVVMGPAPHSLCHIVPNQLPRPRRRSSRSLADMAAIVREHLNRLPCCLAPLFRFPEG